MKINSGDYLLTKEKRLLRIVDVYTDINGTYYDVRDLSNSLYLMAVPRNRLRHLGKVISEEKMTKTMKILYG